MFTFYRKSVPKIGLTAFIVELGTNASDFKKQIQFEKTATANELFYYKDAE